MLTQNKVSELLVQLDENLKLVTENQNSLITIKSKEEYLETVEDTLFLFYVCGSHFYIKTL